MYAVIPRHWREVIPSAGLQLPLISAPTSSQRYGEMLRDFICFTGGLRGSRVLLVAVDRHGKA